MTQHLQGDAADQSQVLGRVIVARPTGVFTKLHIQSPALLIFDAPMTARGGGESILICERTEKIAAFDADVIASDPGGLHPADRLQPRPDRFRVEPVDGANGCPLRRGDSISTRLLDLPYPVVHPSVNPLHSAIVLGVGVASYQKITD